MPKRSFCQLTAIHDVNHSKGNEANRHPNQDRRQDAPIPTTAGMVRQIRIQLAQLGLIERIINALIIGRVFLVNGEASLTGEALLIRYSQGLCEKARRGKEGAQ